ncbi:hypothetical protein LZ30DRAFT_455972 [Colletotrichum cereale]|nr:hypothetical protein LZ30DRAFT_455972 [Colletotrichum cereale]
MTFLENAPKKVPPLPLLKDSLLGLVWWRSERGRWALGSDLRFWTRTRSRPHRPRWTFSCLRLPVLHNNLVCCRTSNQTSSPPVTSIATRPPSLPALLRNLDRQLLPIFADAVAFLGGRRPFSLTDCLAVPPDVGRACPLRVRPRDTRGRRRWPASRKLTLVPSSPGAETRGDGHPSDSSLRAQTSPLKALHTPRHTPSLLPGALPYSSLRTPGRNRPSSGREASRLRSTVRSFGNVPPWSFEPFDDVDGYGVLPRSEGRRLFSSFFFFFLSLLFLSLAHVAVRKDDREDAWTSPVFRSRFLAPEQSLREMLPVPAGVRSRAGGADGSSRVVWGRPSPSPDGPVISGTESSCAPSPARAAGRGEFQLLSFCHVSFEDTSGLGLVPFRGFDEYLCGVSFCQRYQRI